MCYLLQVHGSVAVRSRRWDPVAEVHLYFVAVVDCFNVDMNSVSLCLCDTCGRLSVVDDMTWLLEPIRDHFRLVLDGLLLTPVGHTDHSYLSSPASEGLELWAESATPSVTVALARLDALRRSVKKWSDVSAVTNFFPFRARDKIEIDKFLRYIERRKKEHEVSFFF